ncbi:MAG: GNAT family N-acetyltransferase [Maritimibacter sp.]
MTIEIRPLHVGDFADVGRIFFCAIYEGTRHVYTLDERRAWAGPTINLDHWKDRLQTLTGFIAEINEDPVGFMTIDKSGYIDLSFVSPSCAGQGIGGALLKRVELWASENGASELSTAASLAARPFFEKHGWQVVDAETVTRHGTALKRFQMRKSLQSAS